MENEKIVWNPKRKGYKGTAELRRELLRLIKEDPTLSAQKLAEIVGCSRPTVYSHLRDYHIDNQV